MNEWVRRLETEKEKWERANKELQASQSEQKYEFTKNRQRYEILRAGSAQGGCDAVGTRKGRL